MRQNSVNFSPKCFPAIQNVSAACRRCHRFVSCLYHFHSLYIWYFIQESGQLQAKSLPDWSAMEDRTRMDSVCHLCEKAFTQAGHLKRHHHLTHTGEKSHKCGTCEKTFTQAGHLKGHLLTHTGEKSHKCGTCEKAFTTPHYWDPSTPDTYSAYSKWSEV